MPKYLTQVEVNELEEGEVVEIRYADRSMRKVRREVKIHNGIPSVQEVKPSGFPVWVPLRPVADEERPYLMRVSLPEDD